jgi:hypothetical protein
MPDKPQNTQNDLEPAVAPDIEKKTDEDRAPIRKAASAAAPQVGDMVLYVLPDGAYPGEARPAVVVKVWGDTSDARVNLQVFTDGTSDYVATHAGATGILGSTSVANDEDDKAPGTYHRRS